jgi:hypothetical protein
MARTVELNGTKYVVLERNVAGKRIDGFEYVGPDSGGSFICEEANCTNPASYRLPECEDEEAETYESNPAMLRKVKSSYTCNYLCKDCFKTAFPDIDLKEDKAEVKAAEPESSVAICAQHDDDWFSFTNVDQFVRFLKGKVSDMYDSCWSSHTDIVVRLTKRYEEESE